MKIKKSALEELKKTTEDNVGSSLLKVSGEGFEYCLFDGGYLSPSDFLEGEDLDKVDEACLILGEFKHLLEGLMDKYDLYM